MTTKDQLSTKEEKTWCPGCPNFLILEAVKQTIAKFIDSKKIKKEDFAMVTDIGCHAKMFDYLNLSGIYGLHGRAIPTALGMKLGNPNLKVLAFAGDGAVYSEGISHFIHAFRYNPNMTLFLHNNQNFSLTTGQSTPTSPKGFDSKMKPQGEENNPFNPIKIALASGGTFIARVSAYDIPHMVEIFTKAINHRGFAFVEIIQECLIFGGKPQGEMYKIEDNTDIKKAEKLADEFNYQNGKEKIPLGIIYKKSENPLEEKIPQLKKRLKN